MYPSGESWNDRIFNKTCNYNYNTLTDKPQIWVSSIQLSFSSLSLLVVHPLRSRLFLFVILFYFIYMCVCVSFLFSNVFVGKIGD